MSESDPKMNGSDDESFGVISLDCSQCGITFERLAGDDRQRCLSCLTETVQRCLDDGLKTDTDVFARYHASGV